MLPPLRLNGQQPCARRSFIFWFCPLADEGQLVVAHGTTGVAVGCAVAVAVGDGKGAGVGVPVTVGVGLGTPPHGSLVPVTTHPPFHLYQRASVPNTFTT